MSASSPNRRGGAALVGSLLLASLGNGLFLPLSLVYFTALTDIRLALLGTLLGAANMITVPVPLCAGALADRFGARPVVIGAQVLQAASFLSYVWVRSPVMVFLAAAVGAVGVRFFWSSIFTLIADYTDQAHARQELWYARANITRTVGIGAGGLVTGLLVTNGGADAYHAIAYISFGCFTVAAVTLAAFLRIPRHRPTQEAIAPSGYRDLLKDRPFLAFTTVNTLYALSTLMLGLALPTFVTVVLHRSAWLTSTVLVGNAVLIALFGHSVTRRLAPLRRTRVICAAGGLWACWSLALGAIAGGRSMWAAPAVLIAATLMFTLAEVIHAPASMALAADGAPPRARGRYLAGFQYSFVLAEIIAPVFFTSLFGLGHATPFLVLGALNIAAIACTLRLERHLLPASERPGGHSSEGLHPVAGGNER